MQVTGRTFPLEGGVGLGVERRLTDEVFLCGWEGEETFGEGRGVLVVGGYEFVLDFCHGVGEVCHLGRDRDKGSGDGFRGIVCLGRLGG